MRTRINKAPAAQAVEAVRGSGKPLPPHVQQRATGHYGFGFGHVRVHDEQAAHVAARSLHAAAYTIGGDIGFAAGRYDPESAHGEALLQHELRHVAQQHWAAASRNPQVDPGDSVHERDARQPFARHVPKLSEQRIQCAPDAPLRSPGAGPIDSRADAAHRAHPKPAVKKLPDANIVFIESANRWLITIGGIPVAEVSVKSKETPLQIQVDITPAAASITIRHHGDASLAPATNAIGSLGLSVSLREIDLREGARDYVGPKAPPTLEEQTATGQVEIIIVPPSALRWQDETIGERSIKSSIPPGALSEFEQQLRKDRTIINGVVLDPKTGEVIGYKRGGSGLTQIVDREGSVVFSDEIGLVTPLIDPLDFIPTPGSIGKVGAGIAGRLGIKALGTKAAVKGTKVSLGILARMRGVSNALFGRALRKGAEEAPGFVRKITKAGIDHSFDRHAAQWFGRVVSRETHLGLWRELLERTALSRQVFPWSVGAAKTIGHLARVEGKYFVVQFFQETGELATAFVPNSSQLREMLKLLKGAL